MLKTCGTTTLLKTVPEFLKIAALCGTAPEFVLFTRKNFNFPSKQITPHTGFEAETEYLNQFFNGESHVLGPLNGGLDHWHMYVADLTKGVAPTKADRTLEIMMSELDRNAMSRFYRGELDAKQTTVSTGISNFLPGSISDEVLFNPCGYSVNGLKDEAYYTIHVTPEPQCSFVSFETNINLPNYSRLIRAVLEVFKPGKFCFSTFADKAVIPGSSSRVTFDHEIPGYELVSNNTQSYSNTGYHVTFCSYRAIPSSPHLVGN